MKAKLTKRMVEAVKPAARDVLIWDTAVPGFGVKITPKGRRVFVLQYWRGRSRRVTLGLYGAELTVDEARTKAGRLRGQVRDGADPAAAQAAARGAPTLAEFAQRYLAEHAAAKKAASSAEADERNLRLHILPALGHIRADAITRADVARLHGAMRARPGAANRCLALLSKMMSLAEDWDLRPDGSNPTRHIEKYPEHRSERFLSAAELAHLGAALEESAAAGEHPSAIAAVRLLLLTGCRRDEIRTLRWADVDLEQARIRLPRSKTGARTVALGAPARALLAGLARVEGNSYVLPGARRGRPFVGLQKAWARIRRRATVHAWAAHEDKAVAGLVAKLRRRLGRTPGWAEVTAAARAAVIELPPGLTDVRLHDLRHTHGAVGAGGGESLVLIGKLLGHRQPATTARYAHLSDDPVRDAADRVAGRLDAALRGRAAGPRSKAPPRRRRGDSPSGATRIGSTRRG